MIFLCRHKYTYNFEFLFYFSVDIDVLPPYSLDREQAAAVKRDLGEDGRVAEVQVGVRT